MPLFIDDFGRNNSVDVPSDMVQSLNGRIKFNGDGNTVKLESGTSSIDFFMELGNGNEVRIGKNCSLGKMNLFAKNHCEFILGKSCAFTYVNRYLMHEPTKIHIGNDCLFADGVQMMTSDMHAIVDVNSGERQNYAKDIEIGTHVWLGDHVTILKGVRIGEGSIIGAFAVVTKPIPEFCIAAGNPSRIVRNGATWRNNIIDEGDKTNLEKPQIVRLTDDFLENIQKKLSDSVPGGGVMISKLSESGSAYDEDGSIIFQDATFQIEFLEQIENLISDLEPERISKSISGYGSTIDTPVPKYGANFTEIKDDKTDFDSADANSYFIPAPFRFNIKNGILMTQFGILKLNRFVGRESLFHFPGHKFPRFEKAKWADDKETLFIETKDIGLEISNGYCVQNGIQENYYHWLVLILSKVNSRFLEDIAGPRPTLIFSPFENEVQRQSAQIISEYYSLSYISHRNDVTTFVNNLTYPTINRAGGLRPEPLVKDTFSILKAALYDSNYPSQERIYISRRDTDKRKLRNEREVEDLLSERYGFLVVSLSGRTLYDQINLFSRAKIVISPHGAGLTNIGFCEPETSVLELHMPNYLNWCYRRLAGLHDLRYGFIYGQSDSSNELHADLRSYEISLESLSKAVSEIVSNFIF